jgi:dienelactone hydrolase
MAAVERKLGYEFEGQKFEGILVYDDSVKTRRPAVFMEPDWDGASAKAVEQAKLVAGTDYVVYVADMFGVGYRPKDQAEKMAASKFVHDDIARSRARGNKAMDMFLAEAQKLNLIDPAKVAGVGYCFGAGCLFDLAREGRDLKALVAYHITYPGTVDPAGAAKVKAAALVIHGADDPVTPRAAIHALENEFDAAKVKWQTVMFSGAVHSFCDPEAKAGPTRYDPALAAKSYKLTHDFFREVF